ncbi:MAG: hypothetical protein NVV69_15765 [Methyloversatilis sp.]|uniref:hypothetical protein n=1 Tax=Methyloversatilis sp. TaxID=2569862 RepID=UPI0025E28A33|nr:hypothetical protein [Methyloversatilis sp.]MCR6667432.1 hypothetical protein [Methyloversatilis sp.]
MTPLLEKFLAGFFVFCIGLLLRHFDKLKERETQREIEQFRRRFENDSKRVMFMDFMHALLGSYGPRIAQLVVSPLLAWILIIGGAIRMGDSIILLYWPNP